MLNSGKFDLACAREVWVGAGEYERRDDRLRFQFTILTREGKVVERPAPLEFRFVGRGNQLELRNEPSGERMVWERVLGGH